MYKIENEKITIDQLCEVLSVSKATIKNWIRLGKIKMNFDGETFDKKCVETLILDIKNGKDDRLKSRRNKKSISGKILYKDYIKSKHNLEVVESILSGCEQITEDELRLIIANFAIQLYQQCGGTVVSEDLLIEGDNNITNSNVFNDLLGDLLRNIDISKIDLRNIQYALKFKIKLVPLEDTLGFVYISLRDLNHRKQTGVYYTPAKIVNTLIDNLKKSFDKKGKTFCDPCCGTGNFLIGLVGSGVETENIYGQDIDEISVLITRINMFLLDNGITKEHLYSHFVCGDTLSNTFPSKFSVVLGNPPWGYEFKKKETAYLSANYITAKNKSIESYDIFVEKGLTMLEDDGYLTYVLPETILSVKSHQQIRELMLKNTAFRFVHYLGNVFSGVQCPAIIIGVQYGYHGEVKGCRVEIDNVNFTINRVRDIDKAQFSFNIRDEEYDCLCAISSVRNAKYLANNAKFAIGIVTGNNKEFVVGTKKDGMEAIVKGSDIFRYTMKAASNYIHFVPEKFQQVAPIEMYRAEEKLLYRFIAEVPVFMYDNQQTLSLNSCNILIPQIEGMHIKYILAILNSSVAAYFINKKYNSVKLLKSHIESLPLPMISVEKQNDIIKKVDYIMNSNENISGLYEDLDNDIMALYGLTDKQINTIKTALRGKALFLKNY